MTREKGALPKAYLRIDPDLDSTHPHPEDMVRLLCAGNRQPFRGRFRDETLAKAVLGKTLYHRAVGRGDLIRDDDGRLVVDGWDVWQEGDLGVGERMRRMRERRNEKRNGRVTHAVTVGVTDE